MTVHAFGTVPKHDLLAEREDPNAHPQYVRKAGGDTITASAATVKPLVVKGAASQSANLLEAQDSAGVVRASVDAIGIITGTYLSSGPRIGGSQVSATPASVDTKGLVVRALSGQNANLAEFQNDAGTVLANVNNNGHLFTVLARVGQEISPGQLSVQSRAATTATIVARGAASQTGNLTEWQNSAGAVLARVNASGTVFTDRIQGQTGDMVVVQPRLEPSVTSGVGLKVRGLASQTGDLVQLQNSAGTLLGGFSPAGQLVFNTNNATGTATGGTNGALPSAVAGYMTVKDQTGTTRKIPYYNA